MALGYMSAIISWNRSSSHLELFRNAGPMALTNYLTQTVIGPATLGWWPERFRYGPFEWAWRCAAYRTWQPVRRLHTAT